MREHAKGKLTLAQQSSAPTVSTGTGILVAKTDGSLVYKDDSNVEQDVALGLPDGVTELHWAPEALSSLITLIYLDAADSVFLYTTLLSSTADSKRSTGMFRVPKGAVNNVNQGDDVKFEVMLYHDNGGAGGTGDLALRCKIHKYDIATHTITETAIVKTQAITADRITVAEFQATISLNDGDLLLFNFHRNATTSPTVIDGSDSSLDTVSGTVGLVGIRFLTSS